MSEAEAFAELLDAAERYLDYATPQTRSELTDAVERAREAQHG